MSEERLPHGLTPGADPQGTKRRHDLLKEAMEAVLAQHREDFSVGWEHFATGPKEALDKIEIVLGPAIVEQARKSAIEIPANGCWKKLCDQVSSAVNELLKTHGNSDSAHAAFSTKMTRGMG